MGVPYGDEFTKVTLAESAKEWRRRGYYVLHGSDLTPEQKEKYVEPEDTQ